MLPNITVVEVLVILLNLPLFKKKKRIALYVCFSRDFSKRLLAAILTGRKRAYHWLKLLWKTKLGDVLKAQLTEKPAFPFATTLLQFEIYS